MGGDRTDEEAAADDEEPADREDAPEEQSDPDSTESDAKATPGDESETADTDDSTVESASKEADDSDDESATEGGSVDDPVDPTDAEEREESAEDAADDEGGDDESVDLAPEPDLTESWAEGEAGDQYDIDEAAAVPAEETDEEEADGEDEVSDDDEGEGEETAEDEEDESDETVEPGEAEKVEFHDDSTPIQRKTGPESDTEQPLADHIEEMIKRLAIVVVVAGLVSLAAFPFGEEFINFLWYSVLPADVSQPHVYHPLELVITQLKAASLLGLVLALPVFVYETYAFMRPGLYPHERRYYLAAVPTSLILASIGLLFGYFLVLPAVMTYFLYYSQDVVDIAFALGQTFNLMLILLGYLALVFQIPLFIMLAIMMGLTTRTWLEDRRLIFWGAFLGISFLFSPDPTGMAPILVGATMIALFEGTLLLLRWTKRGG